MTIHIIIIIWQNYRNNRVAHFLTQCTANVVLSGMLTRPTGSRPGPQMAKPRFCCCVSRKLPVKHQSENEFWWFSTLWSFNCWWLALNTFVLQLDLMIFLKFWSYLYGRSYFCLSVLHLSQIFLPTDFSHRQKA